jgi:hypothetical protein
MSDINFSLFFNLVFTNKKKTVMKKVLLLSSFIFLSLSVLFGQHTVAIKGGTITGDVTWSDYDTIYVISTISIGASSSLTIKPNSNGSDVGTYLIFTGNYGINVTLTGSLKLEGTPSEKIILTSDRPEAMYPLGDKNFGEQGETWRNVLLNNTGISHINNCIIEYGYYNNGGGIYIYGNHFTVENSIIKNCVSGNGGAITVRATGNDITLKNLSIHDNVANTNGGGIFFYPIEYAISITDCNIFNNSASNGSGIYCNSVSPVSLTRCYIHDNIGAGICINQNSILSNCLITGNTTGIFFNSIGTIINCDILNNTTGIYSASTSAPMIINSILWGNTNEYEIVDGATLELAYCGIEEGFVNGIDGGGNINLSSTNTSNSGPNFIDPSNNFHLNSWITPLVDGGTSSYKGISAPSTDFDSYSLLNNPDIGAYEFQYLIWTGATSNDWSSPLNWKGHHSTISVNVSDNKVIIPSGCTNYPQVTSLTLSNRSILTIEPRAGLTVTGNTTVNAGCNFYLKSDAAGSANFITGTGVTGTYNVELFLAGGGSPNFKWHYVVTPVNNHSKSALTTAIGNPYNLLNYLEYRVKTGKAQGWNWHDGYQNTDGFLLLSQDMGNNVYTTSDKTAVFTGTIRNSQDYSPLLLCGTVNPEQNGWNLIGNPFTSSIDLNKVEFGENVDPVVYFTKENSYSIYDNNTKQGTNGATNIIPPMQGFFVHATDGWDQVMNIPGSARVFSSSTLYKKSAVAETYDSPDFPLLKFNVSDESFRDEALIYFFENATELIDRDYDAYKLWSKNLYVPQISSISRNIDLALNGLPFPETRTEIPLNIRIGKTKNYSINVVDLENLSGYKITLKHGSNEIDLKTNPTYSFQADSGMVSMSIVFENITTGFNDAVQFTENKFQCWYKNETLYVKSTTKNFENSSTLSLFDVNGNLISNIDKLAISSGQIIELPFNLKNGIYICKLANKNFIASQKVVVVN